MDFELEPAQRQILEFLTWLAKEKMRPLGLEYDKKEEPIPPDHPFFKEIHQMGLAMGIMTSSMRQDDDVDMQTPKFVQVDDKKKAQFAVTAILAAEILAWGDQGVAMSFPGPGLASPPVMVMGTREQKRMFFESFKSDEPKWGAFALTEPGAGSDVARIRTRCVKKGDRWIINGEKMFITNGARAEWVVVFATVDPKLGRDGHRAFLVRKGTPGFKVSRIEKKMGLHASETAGLVFEDCEVPEEWLLGGEEYYKNKAGFKGAMETFNLTRPAVAAMAIGIARAAYEYTRDYFKENYMMSKPSPLFAKIKEDLDRMKTKLDVARMLCVKAAWMMDTKQPNAKESSQAKAYAPQVALWVTSRCVQLLAEEGTLEYHHLVNKCWRDIKIFDIFEGTGQVQRIVISKRIFMERGKPPEWKEEIKAHED